MRAEFRRRCSSRFCAQALAAAIVLVAPLAAHAQARRKPQAPATGPPTPAHVGTLDARAWNARYDHARRRMIDGKFREAEADLRALAAIAPTEADRLLALEMARLSAGWSERPPVVVTTADVERVSPERTSDEITLLYASSFIYGAGTGAWFLLQIQPDSAVTATVPFAALTAAPIIAVATIDGYSKMRRGVPHAISSGLYLGLGEAIWIIGAQHGRAARLERQDPDTQVRWKPEAVSTVLWGGATLGAVLGGALGGALVTTPGRVSFTASTSMWAGALSGLAAGAFLPDDAYRRERAFTIGGAGYNAGLLGGLLGAGVVSPSVARVRLVDLLGLAGGLATTGFYLSLASDPNTRVAEGLAVAGAGAGLAAGWLLTSGMARDEAVRRTPSVVVQPSVVPAAGGAMLGVSGSM